VTPNGAKDRSIDGLKAVRKCKRYQVMGAQVPDLGVRVTHKGTNTFSLRPPRPNPAPCLRKLIGSWTADLY
jgi:hypothetical protein